MKKFFSIFLCIFGVALALCLGVHYILTILCLVEEDYFIYDALFIAALATPLLCIGIGSAIDNE